MGREDLTRARIVDVRALGVHTGLFHPADHRVARVGRVPVRVFLLAGSIHGHDGILKAGRLKGHLPVFHSLLDVGTPLVRPVAPDVVDDGLDRLREFGRGILLLQPVAVDDLAGDHASRIGGAIVVVAGGEVADPGIGVARHHRLVRKQGDAVVHHHRSAGGIA